MQRQRGELVPIGDALADLGGPVQALRETPLPARRGFTVADQVNQLVGASEADPDLGFMGSHDGAVLAAPEQPRQPPSEYKRQSTAPSRSTWLPPAETSCPTATCPASCWPGSATEAVRTQSRELVLGKLAFRVHAGAGGLQQPAVGKYTRLRNQMKRLVWHATVSS